MMSKNLPKRIHVLAKPTGSTCNLNCAYCFYLKKEVLYPGSRFRMTREVLESYLRQLIESHQGDTVTVAWQGGEPTLMGLDFYREAIQIQENYRRTGLTFENTLQTNGILLNDEWCEFLKAHNFLIGISLDGPKELHDVHRMDKHGKGTFDRVMRGVRLLQKHQVDFNVLVTVNRINGENPLDVYRFLRDEVQTAWIQFIPMIERVTQNGITPFQQGSNVSPRTVGSKQWGRFLIAVFDEWIRNDVGRLFIQSFEAAVRNWLGMGSSGMCVFDPVCGHGLALEHNGDLYSCDHFVEPQYLLGNILREHMRVLAASDQQFNFGRDKIKTLLSDCRNCLVRFACHGECPKNRFLTTTSGEYGLNYLCEGYKSFFMHINRPLQLMCKVIKQGLPAAKVMQLIDHAPEADTKVLPKTGRNEPCPCGSGKKFKKCHCQL